MSKSNTNRIHRASKQPPVRSGALKKLGIVAATFWMLGCLIFGGTPAVQAATIPTGASTDVVFSTDGSMSFVLASATSTVFIVDPDTSTITGTVVLPILPNTAQDIDWNELHQKAIVGTNTGQIHSVDPMTNTSLLEANNGAANYSQIVADNQAAANVCWAFDTNTGWLDQILLGGVVAPAAPVPMTTVTEIVERTPDPMAPTATDQYLIIAGTNAGQPTIDIFDRATMTSGAFASWLTAPANVVGVDSSKDGMVYVAANSPGGGGLPAYLLQFDVMTSLWTPGPVKTYAAQPLSDVSVSGQWASVLLINPGGVGSWVDVFDVADGTNVMEAGGVLINPGMNPGGQLDSYVGSAETVDDLKWVNIGATTGANSELSINVRGGFVDAPAATVVAGINPDLTIANGWFPGQEAKACLLCPPHYPEASAPTFNDTRLINFSANSPPQITPPATPASVYFSTGEEVFNLPLLSVPGVGKHLNISLTYRSRQDFDYRYGQGWSLSADSRLKVEASGDRTLYTGHGRKDVFTSLGGGLFAPPVHYDSTLAVGGSTTTITDRHGGVTTYDASGRRISEADRFGNTISYTYTSDQLTSISDSLGRNYTLSYDGTGRLSSIVDFGGRTWSFAYDYLGQLRSCTTPATTAFPSGRTRWFSYSGNHSVTKLKANLIHAWSPKGEITSTRTYDDHDMVIREVIGPGTYEMTYDSLSRKTTVLDPSGNTKEFTYDAQALPLTARVYTKGLRAGEPSYFETEFRYDGNGNLVTKVYPRGNREDYTYNSALNLTELRRKETDTNSNSASDLVTTMTYTGAYNQLGTVTDPRGNTTTFTVDGSGNTTQVSHPTVTSPASQSIAETMTYDAQGRILSVTDGEGRKTEFAYYASGIQEGYLETITRDPTGLALVTTFSYDQYGNVTSITDPEGNTTTLTVDAENFVTEIEAPSPFNYRTRFTYDANRNVTVSEKENIDKDGTQDATTPWIATTLSYNSVDWLISTTVPLTPSINAVTTYEYDGTGNLVKSIDAEGNEQLIEYDERHLLFKATRGYGTADASTIQLDYDLNANLATLTNGKGHATTRTHDLFDRLEKITNALGHYSEFAYDDNSNVTTISAYDVSTALVAKRTNHFDEVNRLWKVVRDRFGSGLTTSYPTTTITRDKGHLVTQISDALSNATTWTYDTAGRKKTVTDAAGIEVTYFYDDNGNVTKIEEEEVPTSGSSETFETEFVYDELNRLVERKEIDRLNASNILSTTYEYDSRNNLAFRTDAEGNPRRWTYDLASRLTTFERALATGATIEDFVQKIEETFDYDKIHRLVEVTDDNFNSTEYLYDALSRRKRTTYADSKYVQWTYDKNDNVSTRTDQNGSVVTNTFDSLDRLTSRSVSKGTGVLGTSSETYTYDALSRMLTAIDDDYAVKFVWDSVGNMLSEEQGYTGGTPIWKTVSTTYSDAGAMSMITYPSGFQVSHTRDAIYRMSAMVDVGAATNVASFTWQGASRLKTTTNQNGTSTDYTWDGFRRIQEIDHQDTSAQSFHKLEYLYDRVHNRRMEKNSYNATWLSGQPAAIQTFLGARNGKGDVYAYDMAYRLVDVRYDVTSPASEVATPGSQTYVNKVGYSLDGLGNRSQVGTTPWGGSTTNVTYSSDVVNEYTSVGGTSRTHDDNGNLANDGTQTYHYDYKNRLVEVKNAGTTATIATYRFDALGRRVEKAVSGGATTRYILDGQQVVEEYDGSNVWQARYVYEDGIDRPRAMDRADQADVDGDANTTEVLRFHYHQNPLGNVTEVTQPTGAVVEWTTYDVYGKATIRDATGTVVSASAIGNPYSFTGRREDPESGLMHYRARAYAPFSGRFIQRDPLGYVDGMNQYEYVRSVPGSRGDPLGLTSDFRGPDNRLPDLRRSDLDEIVEESEQSSEAALETSGGLNPDAHPFLRGSTLGPRVDLPYGCGTAISGTLGYAGNYWGAHEGFWLAAFGVSVYGWLQYVRITVEYIDPNGPDSVWTEATSDSDARVGAWVVDDEAEGRGGGTGWYPHQGRSPMGVFMGDSPGLHDRRVAPNRPANEQAEALMRQVQSLASVPSEARKARVTYEFKTYLVDVVAGRILGAWEKEMVIDIDLDAGAAFITTEPPRPVGAPSNNRVAIR